MRTTWKDAWYAPAPALRLAILRAAAGAFALIYLSIRFRSFTGVRTFQPWEFAPVGLARILGAPLPGNLVLLSVGLAIVLSALFMVGFRHRVVGPSFALLLLWITSYRSSWGMLFHTDNLLCLHVLVLGVAPAADAFSLDALRVRDRGRAPAQEPHGRYGWAIRVLCLIAVCTYVVAGIAKLKLAGLAWANGDTLRTQIAYDNLRKIELGSSSSALGVWLLRHGWVFGPLSILSLLIELGAPLALLNLRAALVWASAAWCFHLGVALLMHIAFPYPLSLVAFLPFFPVERGFETAAYRWLRSKWPRPVDG
jgi:hypothetical protein